MACNSWSPHLKSGCPGSQGVKLEDPGARFKSRLHSHKSCVILGVCPASSISSAVKWSHDRIHKETVDKGPCRGLDRCTLSGGEHM